MEGGPAPAIILPVNKPDDPNLEIETSVPVKQVLATEIEPEPPPADVKNVTSNECGKRFGKSSKLKDHKITHKKIEPYQCDKCGNISQDTKYLTSHMKTVHTNQPSSCPDRSINFKNPTYLGQHLLQTLNMDSKSIIEKLVNGIDTKSEFKITTKQGCICPHCGK